MASSFSPSKSPSKSPSISISISPSISPSLALYGFNYAINEYLIGKGLAPNSSDFRYYYYVNNDALWIALEEMPKWYYVMYENNFEFTSISSSLSPSIGASYSVSPSISPSPSEMPYWKIIYEVEPSI